MGRFGWQMSGQLMIFPFVPYSLIHDLALCMDIFGSKSGLFVKSARYFLYLFHKLLMLWTYRNLPIFYYYFNGHFLKSLLFSFSELKKRVGLQFQSFLRITKMKGFFHNMAPVWCLASAVYYIGT